MDLNKRSALLIRSLMRHLGVTDHIVFPQEGGAVSSEKVLEQLDGPHVGDGTPDAALAISEHAVRYGYARGWQDAMRGEGSAQDRAWDEYDPPEHIKDLS